MPETLTYKKQGKYNEFVCSDQGAFEHVGKSFDFLRQLKQRRRVCQGFRVYVKRQIVLINYTAI